MDLSIIIVNWNAREYLRRCLDSVLRTASLPVEVVVVDNASSDGSAEMVEAGFPQVTLIRNPSNSGFAAANNLGIRRSSGEYVLLLNPDAELHPDALREMVEFTGADPRIGAVGPKLLNSDGSIQENGRRFPSLTREVLHLTRLYKLIPRRFNRLEWGRDEFDSPAEVDAVCGACILVRRETIDSVGLLDEGFFMYYEEVDWCRRMKDAGWRVWYLPSARVTHHGGRSSEQTGLFKMITAYRSQYRYFRKHHGMARAVILRAASIPTLGLMWVKRRLCKETPVVYFL